MDTKGKNSQKEKWEYWTIRLTVQDEDRAVSASESSMIPIDSTLHFMKHAVRHDM